MYSYRVPGKTVNMGGSEAENGSQELTEFLHHKNTLSHSMVTGDAAFITVSPPSAGEKSLPATSHQANGCNEIPGRDCGKIIYPGRSVLYSGQFRPLNRKMTTHYKQPPVG